MTACRRCGIRPAFDRGRCRVCRYFPDGLLPPLPDGARECAMAGCPRQASGDSWYCGECFNRNRRERGRADVRRYRARQRLRMVS